MVARGSVSRLERRNANPSEGLCLETQGREMMARLVHDVVADAMRLNLHGAPRGGLEKANGKRLGRARNKVPNG